MKLFALLLGSSAKPAASVMCSRRSRIAFFGNPYRMIVYAGAEKTPLSYSGESYSSTSTQYKSLLPSQGNVVLKLLILRCDIPPAAIVPIFSAIIFTSNHEVCLKAQASTCPQPQLLQVLHHHHHHEIPARCYCCCFLPCLRLRRDRLLRPRVSTSIRAPSYPFSSALPST